MNTLFKFHGKSNKHINEDINTQIKYFDCQAFFYFITNKLKNVQKT